MLINWEDIPLIGKIFAVVMVCAGITLAGSAFVASLIFGATGLAMFLWIIGLCLLLPVFFVVRIKS